LTVYFFSDKPHFIIKNQLRHQQTTFMKKFNFTIGLISDTHGHLRPQVIDNLQGCDAIIHAGDICDDSLITELTTIAPVFPVAGNMDARDKYPASDLIQIGNFSIYIIHNFDMIDLDLEAAGVNIVIFGHTHQPDHFQQGTVTCINPGSAGPKRHNRPISMAKLQLDKDHFSVEFINLDG